ncbi:MAG: bifunctional alpha,alpha-trehalose-phosphate synthase (UDP-forming)/trehalose-phosphatase [Saprospiraceae bacterium]
MSKTIIISNRLPVKIDIQHDGSMDFKASEGGLATGLGSVYKQGDNIWIGWPGHFVDDASTQDHITDELSKHNMRPVFLTTQEIKLFYEGFSNEVLWPNFHYFPQLVVYDDKYWESYVTVNAKFCDAILQYTEEGDTLWVHDYQLLLLPEMLRAKLPRIAIGYFNHIPFPSFEMFRMLPWRKELLLGLLGADLIGFHTYDDMRHFLSSVNRLTNFSVSTQYIQRAERRVKVDSFPMGIDYDKYAESAMSAETISQEVEYRTALGGKRLILSIDRLDYTKGIPQRLRAFLEFLIRYPEFKGNVSLVMVVVPSRDQVGMYKDLKETVDELVGRINGTHGTMKWTPVHYFYRSIPMEKLSAFYRIADVGLVTPLRDGMNLVAKEFIASKVDKKGVLILSEMAGASKELSEAILINPFDKNRFVDAIYKALTMSLPEQRSRLDKMQVTLKKYNIHHWVRIFMESLSDIKKEQENYLTKQLDDSDLPDIFKRYQSAENRFLFLDYDGTLAGFNVDPAACMPDEELKKIFLGLAKDPKNHVIIISGRPHQTLENWMGMYPFTLIAEHGVWTKKAGGEWSIKENLRNNWKPEIKNVMDQYVDRTPGSFIEEKNYGLVWHYRGVEVGLGELRSRELMSHLRYLTPSKGLQLLEGDKVVEVKNLEVNKGITAFRFVSKNPDDLHMAIGDDWTDEDTFAVMPNDAITIKVGHAASKAKYHLDTVEDVRGFLKKLI